MLHSPANAAHNAALRRIAVLSWRVERTPECDTRRIVTGMEKLMASVHDAVDLGVNPDQVDTAFQYGIELARRKAPPPRTSNKMRLRR